MTRQSLLSGIILSITMVLGACATDTTRQTSSTAPSDTSLNASVTEAVNGVQGVQPNDLTVSTKRGVVTLTGRTQTRTQAQNAIEAARHVPGVEKVDYDINVDEQ